MLGGLWTKLLALLGTVGAAIGGVLLYGSAQRRQGRRDQQVDQLRDAAEREDRGREYVSELDGASRRDLADSVRRNDGRWR